MVLNVVHPVELEELLNMELVTDTVLTVMAEAMVDGAVTVVMTVTTVMEVTNSTHNMGSPLLYEDVVGKTDEVELEEEPEEDEESDSLHMQRRPKEWHVFRTRTEL